MLLRTSLFPFIFAKKIKNVQKNTAYFSMATFL